MTPAITLVPLDRSALPGGVAVRLVAAQPAGVLLASLYGPAALVALAALTATDPVLRPALGGVHLVQPDDWPTAAPTTGTGWILAPFVRAPSPDTATRFSDGAFGVWYGADDLQTAQAEVGHHLARYLARTEAVADTLPRTILHATPSLQHPVIDLRSSAAVPVGVLDPESYTASHVYGRRCRTAQSWGILWPSVRRTGGTCLGILRPPALTHCDPVGTCAAQWDGRTLQWRR